MGGLVSESEAGGGTFTVVPATVQSAPIHTKSKANLMPFIQKEDTTPLSNTKSMPVPGPNSSRSESPFARSAGVWAISAPNVRAPIVTIGPVKTGVGEGDGVTAGALVGTGRGVRTTVVAAGEGVATGILGWEVAVGAASAVGA